LPHKATAARSHVPKAGTSTPSVSAVADTGPATIESLGRQLRDVLPTRRLHSVSLYDHDANVLWLSEGALGPDEHSLVADALDLFTTDTSLASHELSLEDGRIALFLAVRAPTADMVGIAMILADGKSVGDDTLERMAAAPVRAIMLRLAVLMKPSGEAPSKAPAPAVPPALAAAPALAVTLELAPAASAAPGAITPAQMNDILELELLDETPVTVTGHKSPSAAEKAADSAEMMTLEALELMPETLEPAAKSAPALVKGKPASVTEAPSPPAAVPASPRVAVSTAPAPRPKPVPAPAPVAARVPLRAPAPAAPPTELAPAVPEPVLARAPHAAPARVVAPPAPVAVPATPAAVSAHIAPLASAPASMPAGDSNLLLEVLPFVKLRAGGQTRRFQILARVTPGQRDPAALDALVLQRLMTWLATHRTTWSSQPTGFTVNLSIATLEDERFAQKIAAALNAHGIGPETLGFEIAEALCTQRRAQVERFIAQCEKIGAWVVIDDFSFDAQVLPLLRSKAARLVKIDAKLTSSALKDKLCQAMVVATVQAAKVMGIHCSAKKVESQAALQWLTAIGCDFAQGTALGGAQTLESILSAS
jgi:EAL domain-containing protein (putative c-di-GMP-specific phosphodiesterase class I)